MSRQRTSPPRFAPFYHDYPRVELKFTTDLLLNLSRSMTRRLDAEIFRRLTDAVRKQKRRAFLTDIAYMNTHMSAQSPQERTPFLWASCCIFV